MPRAARDDHSGSSQDCRVGARPPTAALIAYSDEHKEVFGVEAICRALSEAGAQIAPSAYYAACGRADPPLRLGLQYLAIRYTERLAEPSLH
jgi:hypothetical protein